jgi:PRA1 family protein 1
MLELLPLLTHDVQVTTRLQKNFSYYRTNYFIFFLCTMCLTFLLHPSALICLGLLLIMWTYLFLVNSGPITIAGREYSDREKLIGASVVSFVVVFFLTSVATTALYGLSISMAMIVLHGALREPDDLFLDEAAGNTNLFSNNMFQGLQPFQQPASGPAMV